MCVSMWFVFFVEYLTVKTCDIQEGNVTTKEGKSNFTRPFPKVSTCKRGSDITKGDVTDVRV